MPLWCRIANVFRADRVNREIDEEIQSHLEEAVEHGRDAAEVRRAFGPMLATRERSHDVRVVAWLDSLRADLIFGWRQILKHRTASAAAILSLALAIGACTAAFRLIDALLLRPLPVAHPGRLYFLTYQYKAPDGKYDTGDSYDYPGFRRMREAVKDSAELMAISYIGRIDITYGADQDMEKADMQYVSGWALPAFGMKAARGRLLAASDDLKPGAHPYAVISYNYWSRRFGRDPRAVGRTFRYRNDFYEIVGILEEGFTGTETGSWTDIFLPTMMNARAIENPGWGWFRTWVQLRPGVEPEVVRQKLAATLRASRQEGVKTWNPGTPRERIAEYVNAPVFLEPAAAGVSGMQKRYRRSLAILAVLVALVLLIACANVANLMTAQAASREREMALRVSIGAGRSRLVQLVLVESAQLALAASAAGGAFAWWAAPFVVGMINPPDNPARLALPWDWRVLGFAVALATSVTFLFGLAPALRASAVRPVAALKGGGDPHSRRRLMNALVAAQVAFCFLVHFVAGLFVSTFDRLSRQPTGFSTERLLVLDTNARQEQPHALWDQVTEVLRSSAGVEGVAQCSWPLLSGNGWSSDIWANGRPPDGGHGPYFLGVSPGWLDIMKIQLLEGRDFAPDEAYPRVAIVNQAFARKYFDGQNPVGRSLEKSEGRARVTLSIVGYVRDAYYRNLREAIRPTIYVPFRSLDAKGQVRAKDWGNFIVRTRSADPLVMAGALRRAVAQARPEFRVSDIRTQEEIVRMQTVRERMLAMLSLFFAVVALLLAGVGLYGVLDYSVLQRRREIGIRMALGAQADAIVRRVTAEVFAMLALGSAIGLGLGIASERYVETLLFQVKPTDFRMLALPAATILAAALLASLPPVLRAVRIDPAAMLRAE
jgi:putative ABC transport system permease protein